MSSDKYKIGVVSLLYGENYEAADDLVAGYVTSNLRKNNHECEMVEIVENTAMTDFEYLKSKDFDILFFAVPTTSNVPEIMDFCDKIKRIKPETIIIMTGWDHHSAPIRAEEILMKCSDIDIIIIGEGDVTAVDLVDRIKKEIDLRTCRGIMMKIGNEIIKTEYREAVKNLDELPFPARDTFQKHNYKSVRISTARGCLGKCTFCPMSIKNTDSAWRGRSPQNVVLEIKKLVHELKVKHFLFIDPTFEDPGKKGKERIAEIAKLIIKENLAITFLINIRAENWLEQDEKLMKLLFNAGLESITVGIESGTEKNLQLYNKRANLYDAERVVRLINKYDIYPAYGFIMFNPYTSLKDLEENNKFIHRLGLGYVMGAYLIRLKAFPNTPIYKQMKADGLIIDKDIYEYTLYDYEYMDENVKKLSSRIGYVAKCLEENPDANYYEVQKLTTFVSRIRRRIGDSDDILLELEELKTAIKLLKSKLNDINSEWFAGCINWARNNGSDKEFQEALQKHLVAIKNEINAAKSIQLKYGKNIMRALKEVKYL